MSFERNTTSKLGSIKDLEKLTTFGFRGEAIASIASVANVLMQTNDGNGGTEIRYDHGEKLYQKACSCKRGTCIEVRNLFEKFPARKQFLKTVLIESMHIIRAMRAFIIIEPDIKFEVYKNGLHLFTSPDSLDLRDRTELLFGHFDQYTELNTENERIGLTGLMFEQAADGPVRKPDFLIFVNRRIVQNPAIVRVARDTYAMVRSRAVNMGAILLFECQENFVDFNVHPQKKEVRFKNEYFVKKFLEDSIADALKRKAILFSSAKSTPPPPMENAAPGPNSTPTVPFGLERQHIGNLKLGHIREYDLQEMTMRGDESFIENLKRATELELANGEAEVIHRQGKTMIYPNPRLHCEQNLKNFPEEALANGQLPWNFVGMFGSGHFAIFEASTGIIFIDLVAAQKCIMFDKFIRSEGSFPSQMLLIPRLVTVDPERVQSINAIIGTLAEFGIEIEIFGRNIYKIVSLPPEISDEMMVQLLYDSSFTQVDTMITREIFAKKICIHLPCQPVRDSEVQPLVSQLLQCKEFFTAPTGSNVLFEIDRRDIEKKFGIQFGLQFLKKAYCGLEQVFLHE
jgi:DNA mismatch repair protein MutL